MRNIISISALIMVLGLCLAPASALEGKNGYTEALLFAPGDVEALDEFTGVDVVGVPTDLGVNLGHETGSVAGDDLAVDSAGRVYALAIGKDVPFGYDLRRSAVVRWTPPADESSSATLETIVFEDREWDYGVGDYVGSQITHVLVAPVALGDSIAKDDLLFVLDGEAIYAIDPDDALDPGALIADVDLSGWYAHWTVSPTTGNIYSLGDGQTSTNGTTPIHEISWSGSAYSDSELTSANVGGQDLIAGADGYLYTLMPTHASPDENTVLQINASNGADGQHATIKVLTYNDSSNFFGWAFDSDGQLWTAGVLRAKRKSQVKSYLSPINAGEQTTDSGSIVTFDATYSAAWSMAGGSDGALYVGERSPTAPGVYALTPSTDGGGDTGGGGGSGKGGGKGKKKK